MDEEEELRAKISRLAGQINRRKNEQLLSSTNSRSYPYPPRHPSPYDYSRRGHGNFGRVQLRNPVILNSNRVSPDSSAEGVTVRAGSTLQWKKSTVLEKDVKASRDERTAQNHKIENQVQSSTNAGTFQQYVEINGAKFRVEKGGRKLVKRSDNPSLAVKTPKEVEVNGVVFRRTKNGNLLRATAAEWSKKTGTKLCPRFTSTGICYKGKDCHGIHDSSKTAICPVFLRTGSCPIGPMCDLSHLPSPEKIPSCTHFLRGNCTNSSCPYSHAPLNPAASICRSFALLGYCENGQTCRERHLRECPDYFSTGSCRIRNCNLPHVDHAGRMRTRAVIASDGFKMDVDGDGISSDGELYDRIDSDDLDSDGFDEPEQVFGGNDDGELLQQNDFVRLQ